jgi:hypothetical protein
MRAKFILFGLMILLSLSGNIQGQTDSPWPPEIPFTDAVEILESREVRFVQGYPVEQIPACSLPTPERNYILSTNRLETEGQTLVLSREDKAIYTYQGETFTRIEWPLLDTVSIRVVCRRSDGRVLLSTTLFPDDLNGVQYDVGSKQWLYEPGSEQPPAIPSLCGKAPIRTGEYQWVRPVKFEYP